jgi:hypothetical protein
VEISPAIWRDLRSLAKFCREYRQVHLRCCAIDEGVFTVFFVVRYLSGQEKCASPDALIHRIDAPTGESDTIPGNFDTAGKKKFAMA